MKPMLPILLVAAILAAGCGDDNPGHGFYDDGTPIEDTNTPPEDANTPPGDDGNPGEDTGVSTTCLPSTGTSGTATVEPGIPVTLATSWARP